MLAILLNTIFRLQDGMDHIITSIDQIEVGDKLLLLSNVGVTDTNPNGHEQFVRFIAYALGKIGGRMVHYVLL